jgi:hypothetical protein
MSCDHHGDLEGSPDKDGHNSLGDEPVGMNDGGALCPGQSKGGDQLEKKQEGHLKIEPATAAEVFEDGAVGEAFQGAWPEVVESLHVDSPQSLPTRRVPHGRCEHGHIEVRQKVVRQLENKRRRAIVNALWERAGENQQ